MKKSSANEVTRGQTISFRIPSDTPDHILKQLQRLKESERRNFSSKIAEFVVEGVSNTYVSEREMITIPLPKKISKAQRDWLKHEHSEALLGSIFFQLIADPLRATSLMASLNSNALDIDEALYLQEEGLLKVKDRGYGNLSHNHAQEEVEEPVFTDSLDNFEDDLNDFDWESAKEQNMDTEKSEEVEEAFDIDDLLGDFLSSMNK
jgi:hypothetical protein